MPSCHWPGWGLQAKGTLTSRPRIDSGPSPIYLLQDSVHTSGSKKLLRVSVWRERRFYMQNSELGCHSNHGQAQRWGEQFPCISLLGYTDPTSSGQVRGVDNCELGSNLGYQLLWLGLLVLPSASHQITPCCLFTLLWEWVNKSLLQGTGNCLPATPQMYLL